jgi:hypothetical protein
MNILIVSNLLAADPGGRGGLLDCWDRGFESHWGHGCSFVVNVMCRVGIGFCDEMVTRSEESCRVYVIYKPQQWDGPSSAVAPQKNKLLAHTEHLAALSAGKVFYAWPQRRLGVAETKLRTMNR